MPLIEKEFKHGQAITQYQNLPSAVHHNKDEEEVEPMAPSRPSSSQSREISKRLSSLLFTAETQSTSLTSTATDLNVGGTREGVHHPRASLGSIPAAGSDSDLNDRAVQSQNEAATSPEASPNTKAIETTPSERTVAWLSQSNGEAQPIEPAARDAGVGTLSVEPLLTPPATAIERDHKTIRSLGSNGPMGLQKRTSYIGARVGLTTSASAEVVASTDDINPFVFAPKRLPPSIAEASSSQSYSRSLTRFLTTAGGASSSPRIYPVAYSPSSHADDDQGDDRSENENKSHHTPKHSHSPRHQRTSVGSSRSDPKSIAAAAALSAQTVQVAAAEHVPPAPLHGYQRSVFLRTQGAIAEIFGQPTESYWMKMLNRVTFVLIIFNFCMLASETCEGKNFAGSDPGYPYLPGAEVYKTMDCIISMLFTLELFVRIAAKKFTKAIFTDPFTIADFVALVPWYAQLVLNLAGSSFNVDDMTDPKHYVALLRLLRAVRLGNILRNYDQSRILYLSIRASLRPLGITMFFLCTLVMLLATALFYAEPCYNVQTCQFTDIFNSAYFIMVTYVPSMPLSDLKMTGWRLLTQMCPPENGPSNVDGCY